MRPRKLLWTEGLFLTQHHLQQMDRYHEQLLDTRAQLIDPLAWGITEIEIDERALGLSQFKVSRLQAVLPDGTFVEVGDGEGDSLPQRSLENVLTPQMRSLDVYVAIASESDVLPNTDLENRPAPISRFIRDSGSVLDYNLGAGEQPVQWARKNLRILFGEERQDAVSAIRVAQLARTAAGAIAIRPGFIPPVRRIGANAFLHAGFVRLLEMMTAKQRSLADTRQQRTSAAVEFQASDAAKFWLLNALNSSIPPFAHMVDQRTTDPERAYIELGRLIGQLCTFAVEGDPTTIPKFNYLDLGESFGPMFQRAAMLLDAVVAEKYVIVPLNKRSDGLYLGQIEDPTWLRYEFFVSASMSGAVAEATVRERLPRLAKIASWNQINSILNSALNGAKLELEYRPPGALPVKQGVLFFKLAKTPEFWNDIAGTGTIALYQPIDHDGIELKLYGIDPANLR
jgi:type VI secretion system protein ImpJ